MHELHIGDVMTTRPLSLPVTATVAEALAAARDRDVHHLLMMRGDAFVGVVCVCTLRHHDQAALLKSCVPPRTFAVQAESPLWIARRRFEVDGVYCLPVFDGERLAGVVTRGDLRRRVPSEAPPAELACSFCGETRHVRDVVSGQSGLRACLECSQWTEEVASEGATRH